LAKLYNLARVSTATTGTGGTITLGSAVSGFLTFAQAGIADGDTVTYAIQDGASSEIGRGVYTSSGTTLTRSVLKSTNSNAAISLSGTAQVFITPAAEDFSAPDNVVSVNSGPLAGFRNRLINGCMRLNQRAAASNADDTYAFDRWYILTQTGAVAAATQSLIENGWPYAMRITQSQASAQRFGCAQIIEYANSTDLRGQPVTLSARVRISATTTLRYAILEWTGTANTVTSDVVNDWTSGTFTAGNFFNSTTLTVTATGSTALTANTAATVSLSTTLGSSTTNVIVFFWTDSTQAQNVTLDIGKVQFEIGATATTFEARSYTAEDMLCRRYYYRLSGTQVGLGAGGFFYTDADQIQMPSFISTQARKMRTDPTFAMVGTQGTDWGVVTSAGVIQTGFTVNYAGSGSYFQCIKTGHGLTASQTSLQIVTTSGSLTLDAEI
jgi:hypothetical protein